MNLTRLIRMKEKVSVSKSLEAAERDFILDAVNVTIGLQSSGTVALMMLNGAIAKPSWGYIKRLYADDVGRREAAKKRLASRRDRKRFVDGKHP